MYTHASKFHVPWVRHCFPLAHCTMVLTQRHFSSLLREWPLVYAVMLDKAQTTDDRTSALTADWIIASDLCQFPQRKICMIEKYDKLNQINNKHFFFFPYMQNYHWLKCGFIHACMVFILAWLGFTGLLISWGFDWKSNSQKCDNNYTCTTWSNDSTNKPKRFSSLYLE